MPSELEKNTYRADRVLPGLIWREDYTHSLQNAAVVVAVVGGEFDIAP